jgi:hypothetical protein
MATIDCARCGAPVDTQERHATVETEVVDPTGEQISPSAELLCLDCYDDLRAFLDESDGANATP